MLSLKNPELLKPIHNCKSKYRNQIHSLDTARYTPQKAPDSSGMCGGLSSAHPEENKLNKVFFSPLGEKAEGDAMPVHQHVERERFGLAQSAGETALRRPSSWPASRRGHEEAKTRHFTASQGWRLRNNHRIIELFRL